MAINVSIRSDFVASKTQRWKTKSGRTWRLWTNWHEPMHLPGRCAFATIQNLGVTCSSQQGDSGTLCVSSHGSNSSTECHLVCGTYFGLELVGRLLWRVQTLHCSVFFAANVCHGPMLLLLYFPPEYVATHVVNSTWMVEQLCYGHGNLDGFFHAADFPLLLFARFGRCSSRWMAGIYHFSSECHWELCTEAWSILAMVILILPQPFFCGIWWTFPTSQWEVKQHSLTPQ